MHEPLVNTISFVAGTGFTAGLLFSVAHFFAEEKTAEPPVQEELEWVALAIPPPQPPPRPQEKPIEVVELSEAIPLGFTEEPSSSPVKIAPSPPSFEQLLPMSEMPVHVVSGAIGTDATFDAKMDVGFDSDHIFQRNEVDKPPSVISRPELSMPMSLLGDTDQRSVVLVFVVDIRGNPGNVHLLRPSPSREFDSIVLEYLREWKFSPAIRRGKPVRCLTQQLITVGKPQRDILSL